MNIQVKKAIYNRLVKDIIDRIGFLPLGVVCWVFVFALAKTAALLPCKQAANKQVDDVFINDASFKKNAHAVLGIFKTCFYWRFTLRLQIP
jgi:hypothetical protein